MSELTEGSLVSVVLPCYKMGRYISEALASVGEQSYSRWEVIAVDDCGPDDGTRAAFDAFARRYPEHRTQYIRHEQNKGLGASRNTGMRSAQGEFLAFLDPDDRWGENFLTVHTTQMSRMPDVAMSFTDARHITETGEVIGTSLGPRMQEAESLLESLYIRNFINSSTILVRRNVAEQCQGYDESRVLQYAADWDFALRVLALGCSIHYAPEALSYYRQHPAQATKQPGQIRLWTLALREKHLQYAKYRHFMASYIYELEAECQTLKNQLTEPWYASLRKWIAVRAPGWAKRIWRSARNVVRKGAHLAS